MDSSKAEERMISSLSGLGLYSDLSSKGGGGDKQFVQKGGGEGGSGNKGEGIVFQ